MRVVKLGLRMAYPALKHKLRYRVRETKTKRTRKRRRDYEGGGASHTRRISFILSNKKLLPPTLCIICSSTLLLCNARCRLYALDTLGRLRASHENLKHARLEKPHH